MHRECEGVCLHPEELARGECGCMESVKACVCTEGKLLEESAGA